MDELGLFTAALGLSVPWRVVRSEFDPEATELDLYLDFERGAQFACPVQDCAHERCLVHDSVDKRWRHLDFFQHRALLHARLPRVRCPEHGVRQVSVPWARARGAAGERAVGPAGLRIHPVIRSTGAQLRNGDAGGEDRCDDG